MTNYNERLDEIERHFRAAWKQTQHKTVQVPAYGLAWHEIMQLITAERKRAELEARLDENNMYIRELTRHYFPSSPSEPHIPLVQFHERIAELKAQQEQE